ncbi:MAG: NUDIX hydrolase [Gammaproteobacteria bacterium]|nr:NUDIX hydrolase [Gammaproteobacteria bacterium]
MKFCSECGQPVILRTPAGDNLPRYVCEACQVVHYQNPKIVAGCIPILGNQVLLCRRAIEPRHGLWTLPAGFMENAETLEQAASREASEEANAKVSLDSLYTVISLPQANQVYVMYRATLLDPQVAPGSESLEVRMFREDEIPWQQLAFKTIAYTLDFFFKDRHNGHYGLHTLALLRDSPEPSR